MDQSNDDMTQTGSAPNEQDQEAAKRQGLVTVNDLNYTLEPDLSVAVNRTGKKHFFQSTEYLHNQQGICILNSGADYVDTRTSYLSFEVEIPEDGADVATSGYFGTHGSACNLIDTLTISTRSGDELCRLTEFGLLQNMLIPLQYNGDWVSSVGSLMGMGGKVNSNLTVEYISGGRQRFLIPMYILAPLFGYGRLMPASLLSGLRFLVQWQTPDKAFLALKDVKAVADLSKSEQLRQTPAMSPYIQNTVFNQLNTYNTPWDKQATISKYTIKNAYFYLTSVQLSDSIQRALNEQSATNGLEIVYSDYERTESVYSGAANLCNIEVRKSCSRALKAFCRVRAKTTYTEEKNRDSFRSEKGFPWREYQWQLGSLYFPQQPVRCEASNIYGIGPESYAALLESCDRFTDSSRQPLLTFDGSHKDGHMLYASFHDMYPEFNPVYNDTLGATYDRDTTNLKFLTTTMNAANSISRASVEHTGLNTFHSPFNNIGTFSLGRVGSFMNDSHTIGVNLERTTLFNLAGVPVNNSRVLALRGLLHAASHEPTGFGGTEGILPNGLPENYYVGFDKSNGYVTDKVQSRSFTVYLKYVKLCRIFLNNV